MAAVAPFLVVGDILEIRAACWHSPTAQLGLNTVHARVSALTLPGIVTVADVAAAFDTVVNAAYKALMANSAEYYGVGVRIRLPSLRKSLTFGAIANRGNGTAGIELLPKQTAGLFTKQTQVAGRRGRGRMYIPFPASLDNETVGQPTAGYMVNLGILAALWFLPRNVISGLATATIQPVLLALPGGATTDLSGATARRKWATHRSRGAYGRTNALPDWQV